MLQHVTTALGGPVRGRGRVPVRRQSRLAGREATFWQRTDRRAVRRVLLAAKRYELVTRGAGRRNGALGHVALEVLELLTHLVDYRTGRLEPAIDTLAAKLRRARSAVIVALAALKTHGFLDWLRRYEPTGREGRGPQVRQVSNAYRLALPPRALRLLGIHGKDAPLPDDVAQEQQERREGLAAIRAALPLDELPLLEVDDGPLGRLLAELGRRIQQRESARRSVTQTKNA
jgi:hypothetical protein